jgi:ABC-type multidrug transport system fused ATPase/permease subunit
MFFEWFSQFEEAFAGVEKMDEYIRHPIETGLQLPAQSDFSTNHPRKKMRGTKPAGASISPQSEYHIQAENLSFHYPTSQQLILANLSFKIKRGEKLGIVGRTGSGKTTLISVLLKLYPLDQGVILINGRSEENLETHRDLFSVISQDQLFITGNIKDNLDLFGRHTPQEVEDVLSKVGLKFNLSDTVLEKGQNLSYGEKQLLSLARGLLKKSEIFIFDEATSNVDPQSETLMNKALSDILADKTQIRIAHRLQTVESCDSLLWLDSGKIQMLGPTKEVLEAFHKSR